MLSGCTATNTTLKTLRINWCWRLTCWWILSRLVSMTKMRTCKRLALTMRQKQKRLEKLHQAEIRKLWPESQKVANQWSNQLLAKPQKLRKPRYRKHQCAQNQWNLQLPVLQKKLQQVSQRDRRRTQTPTSWTATTTINSFVFTLCWQC